MESLLVGEFVSRSVGFLEFRAGYNLCMAKYDISFTESALEDLAWFKKRDQNEIRDGIYGNLQYVPTVEARNRKRLRPNETANGN